jgi:rhodanese-related sulfurtransferase
MTFETITRDEFLQMREKEKNLRIVDVLDMSHFNKEHIKGAINLPLEKIERKAYKFLNPEDPIVVYCAGFACEASTKAAGKLVSMGFKKVFDYKGGLEDYKEAKLPIESGITKGEEIKKTSLSPEEHLYR